MSFMYEYDDNQKYCYEGTDVLKNKMDLKDWSALHDSICEAISTRTAEMQEVGGIAGHYNLDHLRRFHNTLFQDIFDWAGEVRDCEINDKRFCPVADIKDTATQVFLRLENEDYLKGLTKEDMADRLAYYFHEMDRLHPFRCGNMAAINAFLTQMCQRVGYAFDISKATKEEIDAARDSALNNELDKIMAVFMNCVEKIPRKK